MKIYRTLYVALTVFAFLTGCRLYGASDSIRPEVKLRPLPSYSFIKYEDNVLQLPGERDDFRIFYQKLDSLLLHKQGHIRIVHIGGSHVQAGHLSHRMRTNFATLADSVMTERGLVFPFRALKTNAPQSYRFTHTGVWNGCRCIKPYNPDTLGISGAAISTCDSTATLSLTLENNSDSIDWNFTRLRIMGYATDTASYPYAIHRGDTLLPRHLPESHSYLIDFPESCDSVCLRFHLDKDSRFTLNGIMAENDRYGITYHATGINGADVPAWLRCAFLPQDLQQVQPDLTIFGIGINDANVPPQKFNSEQFKANYRELIARFKAANPHCALLFITNNDCLLNLGRRYGKRTNPNTARVAKAFKELAAEYDGAVWDQYHIMGGSRSSALWKAQGLMRPDRIHFTIAGYQLLADMLYNAILTDYLHANGN